MVIVSLKTNEIITTFNLLLFHTEKKDSLFGNHFVNEVLIKLYKAQGKGANKQAMKGELRKRGILKSPKKRK